MINNNLTLKQQVIKFGDIYFIGSIIFDGSKQVGVRRESVETFYVKEKAEIAFKLEEFTYLNSGLYNEHQSANSVKIYNSEEKVKQPSYTTAPVSHTVHQSNVNRTPKKKNKKRK